MQRNKINNKIKTEKREKRKRVYSSIPQNKSLDMIFDCSLQSNLFTINKKSY